MSYPKLYKLASIINAHFDNHIASAMVVEGGMILTICGKGVKISDDLVDCDEVVRSTQSNDWRGATCGLNIKGNPND